MNEYEYLSKRIEDLQKNTADRKLPLSFRRNQAHALLNYTREIQKLTSEQKR